MGGYGRSLNNNYVCSWPAVQPRPPPPPPRRGAVFSFPPRGLQPFFPAYGHHIPAANKQLQQTPQQLKKKKANSRRRRSGNSSSSRRRRRQAAAARRASVSYVAPIEHPELPPQSPVCPPAPYNSNSYLCQRMEQLAAEQVAAAAEAQAAEAAAASLAEVAEWDPIEQQVLLLPQQQQLQQWDEPASPVCPPAPLLDNEFYMDRFAQERLAQQAAAASLAQAAVVEAAVAEWDPLLQEVIRIQHSTASAMPACSDAHADDACSQC